MNQEAKKLDKFMDWYVKMPLVKDFIFLIVIWIASSQLSFIPFKLTNKDNQINLLSNIIGASVSLAGFLIAALTILVTFKLSAGAKTYQNAAKPSEMIFISRHYYNMMAVFRDAIIELLLSCLGLYIVWASSENLSIGIINRTVVTGIGLAVLPIFRSLMLLFRLLSLDKKKELNQYALEEDD